jgi:hypothetical protein
MQASQSLSVSCAAKQASSAAARGHGCSTSRPQNVDARWTVFVFVSTKRDVMTPYAFSFVHDDHAPSASIAAGAPANGPRSSAWSSVASGSSRRGRTSVTRCG